MGLILDTTVLVAARQRRFDLQKTLRGYGDLEIGIAAITAAELVRGVATAPDGAGARAQRKFYVDGILEYVPVMPFGLAEAREYARIWAALSTRKTRVGPHELLIAATALSLGWALMTLNAGDYEPVDGLVLAPLTPMAESLPPVE